MGVNYRFDAQSARTQRPGRLPPCRPSSPPFPAWPSFSIVRESSPTAISLSLARSLPPSLSLSLTHTRARGCARGSHARRRASSRSRSVARPRAPFDSDATRNLPAAPRCSGSISTFAKERVCGSRRAAAAGGARRPIGLSSSVRAEDGTPRARLSRSPVQPNARGSLGTAVCVVGL
jgi:hypothetical protein